jgi:hypothetical protein
MVFATLKDGTVVNIRVLGKRVVAPDNDILDVFHRQPPYDSNNVINDYN